MNPASTLPLLLLLAWLLPLVSFVCIVLAGKWMGRGGSFAAYVATGAILTACVLSMIAMFGVWLPNHPLASADHAVEHHEPSHDSPPGDSHHGDEHARHPSVPGQFGRTPSGTPVQLVSVEEPATGEHGAETEHGHDAHGQSSPHYSGDWYTLAKFGDLRLTIGYYIDALTVAMFCMVTLIASCIHFYAMGYMHDELHEITDHEVTLSDGRHLHRPGRYYRFFQYLSLFCFSMLGIVVAGNIAMTFVFWELVGICSYFLIGFYIERKSASTAANKAFIVNRVGDFGMIVGLMALFGALGTFSFGDWTDDAGHTQPGIFSQVRPAEVDGKANHHALIVPDGMVKAEASQQVGEIVRKNAGDPEAAASEIAAQVPKWRAEGYGYWLLVVAGLGIFCGCVGKSAQFPLHVWLPDAMEGPTPVSALVHSATMVAAGVYLVGRFFPVFTPEVLLVIAYVGAITLFMAATIAITATDIKRVLAYSTVSQLGYMMLALGLGGWLAGLFHLFTHAFFKSLLFMCSGSVIHAVHTNEMPEMGGLLKKMPYTGWTMLVGCLAIAGAGIPFVVGLSGYYSKDAILEHGLLYAQTNATHAILFYVAAGGAALTAFYMFRMWFLTFVGKPRNEHRYAHAHESPPVMVYPLVLLAALAIGVAWQVPGTNLSLMGVLEQARPAGTLAGGQGFWLEELVVPNEHHSHADPIKWVATWTAFFTALSGALLACVIYWWRYLDAAEIRDQFRRAHRFLINKWWFDELYQMVFVRPTHFVARRIAQFDRLVIDGIIHATAWIVRQYSLVQDLVVDRGVVDGTVNVFANRTWNLGLALRSVQTGRLRQYVMFIIVGTIGLFMLVSLF